jgi:DNA-binding MarR family transcriptional regulator
MDQSGIRAFSKGEMVERQADQIRHGLSSVLKLVDEIVGASAQPPVRHSHSITEPQIRSLLKLRRNRASFFDADLFADPAWDMLLELYAAELGQRRITITSLCGAAAVPGTTALRWIGNLEARQLIRREKDHLDGRRFYVSLTGEGLEAIENYFRTVQDGQILV